jgi:hypothetical protein
MFASIIATVMYSKGSLVAIAAVLPPIKTRSRTQSATPANVKISNQSGGVNVAVKIMKSECCGAKVWVACGRLKVNPDDSDTLPMGRTYFYLCDNCCNACDAVKEEKDE